MGNKFNNLQLRTVVFKNLSKINEEELDISRIDKLQIKTLKNQ